MLLLRSTSAGDCTHCRSGEFPDSARLSNGVEIAAVCQVGEGEPGFGVGPCDLTACSSVTEGARRRRAGARSELRGRVVTLDFETKSAHGKDAQTFACHRVPDVAGYVFKKLWIPDANG